MSDRFKHTISGMVFRTVRNLPSQGPRAGFRAAVVAALVEPDDHREPYLLALRAALADCDPNLQGEVADLIAALNAAFPVWPGRP
ncbi:hypothetical protein D3C72_2115180 [compost metagenome]